MTINVNSVIHLKVDDIEAVIQTSKHFRYDEERGAFLLNRISDLPESKARLKRGIKERIQLLTASYISLASFVADEDADYVAGLYGKTNKRKVKRIFNKVIREMNALEKEMRNFDTFKLPTAKGLGRS